MKLQILKGTTSKSIDVFIRDSSVTTGAGLTGLAFNTASLTCYYHRPGSAATAVTLATLASATAAYSSGGFIAVDGTNMPGLYRLDLPDAVLASGVNEVVVMLRGAANMEPVVLEIQLTSVDINDSVRAGLSALPNAAATAAGGLFTRGTGAGQINQDANGRIDVNVAAISTDSTAADNLESYTDGTTPQPVNVTQFGGAAGTFASGRPEVNASHFGGTAGTFSGGIPSVNTIQWRGVQPNNLTSGRVETLVGAMAADTVTASAMATDAVNEIRDAVTNDIIETEGNYTVQQALSIMLTLLAGRNSGGTFSTPNGVASRAAITYSGGNRTASTLTPSS